VHLFRIAKIRLHERPLAWIPLAWIPLQWIRQRSTSCGSSMRPTCPEALKVGSMPSTA